MILVFFSFSLHVNQKQLIYQHLNYFVSLLDLSRFRHEIFVIIAVTIANHNYKCNWIIVNRQSLIAIAIQSAIASVIKALQYHEKRHLIRTNENISSPAIVSSI